eukprot:9504108-Pyramimonas_sp.AAC.1
MYPDQANRHNVLADMYPDPDFWRLVRGSPHAERLGSPGILSQQGCKHGGRALFDPGFSRHRHNDTRGSRTHCWSRAAFVAFVTKRTSEKAGTKQPLPNQTYETLRLGIPPPRAHGLAGVRAMCDARRATNVGCDISVTPRGSRGVTGL